MTFHEDLCQFLPLAKELRDFRYQREEISETRLVDLLLALGKCEKLQRIVIRQDAWSQPIRYDIALSILFLISSVFRNLQLFCLVYPVESEDFADLRNQANEKILPYRPSFWFYIGDDFPHGPQVPRIHYDEIINPSTTSYPCLRCDTF